MAIEIATIHAEELEQYRIDFKLRYLPSTAEFPKSAIDMGCLKIHKSDLNKHFYEPVKFRENKNIKLAQIIEALTKALVLVSGSAEARILVFNAVDRGLREGREMGIDIKQKGLVPKL